MLTNAVHIAGRILDADNVRQLGEACDGIRCKIDHSAARHIV